MYSGKKAQHDFPKMRGGGSKAVWNFSKNSSVLEEPPFPNQYYHILEVRGPAFWLQDKPNKSKKELLLAMQNGAYRRGAYRDFHLNVVSCVAETQCTFKKLPPMVPSLYLRRFVAVHRSVVVFKISCVCFTTSSKAVYCSTHKWGCVVMSACHHVSPLFHGINIKLN